MSGRKLTVDEKHTAEELYAHDNNTPNPQIARRFQALALLRRGRTLKETAAIIGVSIRAVQKWRTGFRTGGLDELTRRTRGMGRWARRCASAVWWSRVLSIVHTSSVG